MGNLTQLLKECDFKNFFFQFDNINDHPKQIFDNGLLYRWGFYINANNLLAIFNSFNFLL